MDGAGVGFIVPVEMVPTDALESEDNSALEAYEAIED